ncbi:MAG: htrA [Phycisphaerales bacterium]|nr:htrA [Phycisphaerales bacterium]
MDCPLRNTLLALTTMAVLGLVPALSRAEDEEPAPDKQQYIRRLTLDLTGQPPTRQEVQTFVEDRAPGSYKRLITRLDPARGETLDAVKLDDTVAAHFTVVQKLDEAYRIALNKRISAAYLGLGVESPTATIRAQLRLPDGAGLVVNFVDPEGPSKGLVQQHDVLQKLDEQILVNGEQLIALVRMHKRDETITLTVIREAKPVTVPIKLAEKQVEALGAAHEENALYTSRVLQAGKFADWDPNLKTNEVQLLTNGADTVRLNLNSQLGVVATKDLGETLALAYQPLVVAQQTGPLTFDDGKTLVLYYLSPAGKPQTITVLDRASGKVMFSGPAGNEEQWKAVPDDVRQKIAAWRDMLKQVNGTPSPATQPAEK